MRRLDFVRMRPDPTVVTGGIPPQGRVQALVEPGQQYAVYAKGSPLTTLTLALPPGEYHAEWIDVVTGSVGGPVELTHAGGPAVFTVPHGLAEVALHVRLAPARPSRRQ